MEQPVHSFTQLFAQLGLPSDEASIRHFIGRNCPLDEHLDLADATCWTPAQAAFLREEIGEDADWAEVVDELNLRLHTAAQ